MDFKDLLEEFNKQKVEMSGTERREAYWKGEEVDFLPYDLNGSDIGVVNSLGYMTSDLANKEINYTVQDKKLNVLGIDDYIFGKNYAGIMGSKQVVPQNGTAFITEHFLDTYDKLESLPSLETIDNCEYVDKSLSGARDIKEKFPDIRLRYITNGPWSSIAKIRSVEKLLKDIRKNKDYLIDLLEYVVKFNTRLMEKVVSELGPVEVFMTDPVSCMDLLAPKQFEDLSLPYLNKLISNINNMNGKKVDLHICGHTKAIWPYLRDLDIRLFSLDNLEKIEELKDTIGDKVGISGNISPMEIFLNGSIDDVIEAVKSTIRKSADCKSGFIIDAGCQLPLNVPKENIIAYVYAVRKYGANARKGQVPKAAYED